MTRSEELKNRAEGAIAKLREIVKILDVMADVSEELLREYLIVVDHALKTESTIHALTKES